MPGTVNYGFPYPALTDPPNGPLQVAALAAAVDTALDAVDDRVDVLEAVPVVVCHVYQPNAATTPIPNATPTAIGFTGEEVDTHNGHSTSVNTSRYTPTVAGRYECIGHAAIDNTATGQWTAGFRKNGAVVAGSGYGMETAVNQGFAANTVECSASIQCNGTTDYIEMWLNQNSGVTKNTFANATDQRSHMIIKRVSP